MNRIGLPSTRSRPAIGCGLPVQCTVLEAVRSSVSDQIEKYGLCVISGVAGGRMAGSCAEHAGTAARKQRAKAGSRTSMRVLVNAGCA